MDEHNETLGMSVDVPVVRIRDGAAAEAVQPVAAEVPCTIIGNDVEVGTLLCSPSDLKELAVGFLFTSAFIRGIDDIRDIRVDPVRWTVSCALSRTPEPELMAKRMYTPGCGKGVVYSGLAETGLRAPIESSLKITAPQIFGISAWLQRCSELYRSTGGVHTAALSTAGEPPHVFFDDIGRHNAVDKVIGSHLLARGDFSREILISSGRVSSEILHKARRPGIAIVVSRGAPTHQSVLRGRDMGITLVCFARSNGCTIYSHPERIEYDTI